MIDARPTGLGRNPAALARVSVVAKLHVVATTGAHREAHYSPVHWLLDLTEAQLADRFITDITDGMPPPIRLTELPRPAEGRATQYGPGSSRPASTTGASRTLSAGS